MNVAIIPARGGSKRIPRKNINVFCGKPMIAWSIEAARASACFDRIIVSTDDTEIARVARRHGAEVPFLRPAELADDHTGTIPVVAHAIEWLGQAGQLPDAVCCLYATAPFVRPRDLQRGWQALQESGAEYAFSVTSFPFPIQRAIRITPQGRIAMFQPEHFQTRSQDLEEAWHDAGQFYWGRAHAWLAGTPLFDSGSVPVPLPRHRVQDIDTLEDWQRAEWLFRAMQDEM
ncbi:MAG: pseudaminic acid cytidylyltransferase [Halomonas sp.]|nr:pseudaminic acid cytidylyltransferase [Halomonas sp.]